MEDAQKLSDLKLKLLQLAGCATFGSDIRELLRSFLSLELAGYWITTEEAKLQYYEWEDETKCFELSVSGVEGNPRSVLNFGGSIPECLTESEVKHYETIKELVYKSIVFHHLLMKRPQRQEELEKLTKREREILQAIAEGADNREIAHRLGIRYRTVEKHCENIYQKLEVENRNLLIRWLR